MKKHLALRLIVSVGVLFVLALAGWVVWTRQSPRTLTHLLPGASALFPHSSYLQVGPLLSRNVPAFASTNDNAAADANGDNYDSFWRSQGTPSWLAYDLSVVPKAHRDKILVVWYNGTGTYDHTVIKYPAYNVPENYTLDASAAPGGGQPPTQGWVTLVTVQNNHYHSRQHVLDMTGYNWLRINVTASDGSTQNMDASLHMDIYDASTALQDDWIFYGDSITAGAMDHQTLDGVLTFAQLIHSQQTERYPVQESGGIGYLTSTRALQYLDTWLSLFPGKYVGLSYGTNDALGCLNPATFYRNYATMVQDVLHAGKVPVIPHIPWGTNSRVQHCVPALNARIDALYTAFPQIIHGPDLWTFFQQHPDLISSDGIHPTQQGFGAYRQQWALTMLSEVYAHS